MAFFTAPRLATASGASSVRPHAVSGVSGFINSSYTYDANGNLTSGNGRTLTYASFNLPATVSATGYSYTYTYSAEHERVRLVTVRPDDTLTTIYVHPNGGGSLLYEKETKQSTGEVENKFYVSAGKELVGVYVINNTVSEMRYYHRDHLGSVAVITNPAGAVLERLAYEAFGERRNPNGTPQDRASPIIGITTDRGFTAHEHLDELNLIHMNGRIYDPALARFMTPDPEVQFAADPQGFNRYSYVLNNPLTHDDPTGYSLRGFFRGVVAVTALIYAPEIMAWSGGAFASAAGVSAAVGQGIVGGAIIGFVSTGTVQGTLSGGFSGALFGGIGDLGLGGFEKIAAHAAGGCLSGIAGGGDCAGGALSAGAGAALGPLFSGLGPVGEGIARAALGGTFSVLGGGKFANGALTATYAYLFNDRGSHTKLTAQEAGKFGEAVAEANLQRSAMPGDIILKDLRGYSFDTGKEIQIDRALLNAEERYLVTAEAKWGETKYTPNQVSEANAIASGRIVITNYPDLINPRIPLNEQFTTDHRIYAIGANRIMRSETTKIYRQSNAKVIYIPLGGLSDDR